MNLRHFALAVPLLAVVGCSDDPESSTSADAMHDASPDAASDAEGTETSVDAGDDAGSDTAADVAADAPSSVTVPQWCRQSDEIWCEWMYRCFDATDIGRAERGFSFDEETCASVLTADCQARTGVSVNEGRQEFDGEQAAICLSVLVNEECGTLDEQIAGEALNPPECSGVTTGLVGSALQQR